MTALVHPFPPSLAHAHAPGAPNVAELLDTLLRRRDLGREGARDLMERLVSGELGALETGSLLVALRAKGETPTELAGFVDALAAHALPTTLAGPLLDTCGTGGDGQGTFNISTATAFVVASLGVRVAKHGNRSVSSRAGSSDVLAALGANVDLDAAAVGRCVDAVGVGFLFAPRFHPLFRAVADVRRALGVRTVFNLLGPLLNPAPITHQLLGVFAPEWVEPLARVLRELGRERALVVHGAGADEVTLAGPTLVTELSGRELRSYRLTPASLGLPAAPNAALRGGDATENAALLRAVLAGERSARSDAVAASAGVALYVASVVDSPREGVCLAQEALGDGRAARTLDAFLDQTRSCG
jgi:anthranilate phosphoribosyltransferase